MLVESKKLGELLNAQQGEYTYCENIMLIVVKTNNAILSMHEGIRLGVRATELHLGKIFYAQVGYVRFYVLATSEDEACDSVSL